MVENVAVFRFDAIGHEQHRHLGGRQRRAAERKEAVVGKDLVQSEDGAEDLTQTLLERLLRFSAPLRFPRGLLYLGEAVLVDLSVGRERHGVKLQQNGGHHVLRQMCFQMCGQRVEVDGRFGGEEADEVVLRAVIAHEHLALLHGFVGTHHQVEPLGRIRRVEREIRAARLEDAERTKKHMLAARDQHTSDFFLFDAAFHELGCQRVGQFVDLAVGVALATVGEADVFRRFLRLCTEEGDNGHVRVVVRFRAVKAVKQRFIRFIGERDVAKCLRHEHSAHDVAVQLGEAADKPLGVKGALVAREQRVAAADPAYHEVERDRRVTGVEQFCFDRHSAALRTGEQHVLIDKGHVRARLVLLLELAERDDGVALGLIVVLIHGLEEVFDAHGFVGGELFAHVQREEFYAAHALLRLVGDGFCVAVGELFGKVRLCRAVFVRAFLRALDFRRVKDGQRLLGARLALIDAQNLLGEHAGRRAVKHEVVDVVEKRVALRRVQQLKAAQRLVFEVEGADKCGDLLLNVHHGLFRNVDLALLIAKRRHAFGRAGVHVQRRMTVNDRPDRGDQALRVNLLRKAAEHGNIVLERAWLVDALEIHAFLRVCHRADRNFSHSTHMYHPSLEISFGNLGLF